MVSAEIEISARPISTVQALLVTDVIQQVVPSNLGGTTPASGFVDSASLTTDECMNGASLLVSTWVINHHDLVVLLASLNFIIDGMYVPRPRLIWVLTHVVLN